jgi:hypothetical protein
MSYSRTASAPQTFAAALAGDWWNVPSDAELYAEHRIGAAKDATASDEDRAGRTGGDSGDERDVTGAARIARKADGIVRKWRSTASDRFMLPQFWQSPLLRCVLVEARASTVVKQMRDLLQRRDEQPTLAAVAAALHENLNMVVDAMDRVTRFADRVEMTWQLLEHLHRAALDDLEEASEHMKHFAQGRHGGRGNATVDVLDASASLCRLDTIARSLVGFSGSMARQRASSHLQVTITSDVFDSNVLQPVSSDILPGLHAIVARLAQGNSSQQAEPFVDAASELAQAVTRVQRRVTCMVGLWSDVYGCSDVDAIVASFLWWYRGLREAVEAVKRQDEKDTARSPAVGAPAAEEGGAALSAATDLATAMTIRGLGPDQVERLFGAGPPMPRFAHDGAAVIAEAAGCSVPTAAQSAAWREFSKAVVLDVRSTLDSFCKTTVDGWRTECQQLQATAKEIRRLLREALPTESAAVPVITIQQASERDSPALLAATLLDVVDGSPPLIRPVRATAQPSTRV